MSRPPPPRPVAAASVEGGCTLKKLTGYAGRAADMTRQLRRRMARLYLSPRAVLQTS
jgi:hypothetical protein